MVTRTSDDKLRLDVPTGKLLLEEDTLEDEFEKQMEAKEVQVS